MKSERRHELQHNELAEWLVQTGRNIQPYQNIVLAVAVAILVAVAGYKLWARQSAATDAEAWNMFNMAIDRGDLPALADVMAKYPNSVVGNTAAVVLGDSHLAGGCARLFVNKASAREELNRAADLYKAVREQCQTPSLLERATFGLARATEAKGDLPAAEKLYQEVGEKWPNGAYAAAAAGRLADLKRPATKLFYDEFARFDPKPAFSDEPDNSPSFDAKDIPSETPVQGSSEDSAKPDDQNAPQDAAQKPSADTQEN